MLLHPKTDIRSMFNKTPGQNYASAAEPVPPVITAEAVAAVVVVPPAEKKRQSKEMKLMSFVMHITKHTQVKK